jgi:hypothetical protein
MSSQKPEPPYRIPLDEALTALGPSFTQELRNIIAPVRDLFFQMKADPDPDHVKDGLHTAPPYLTDPQLREVATALAELALTRGIDANLAVEPDGTTFLHAFVCYGDGNLASCARRRSQLQKGRWPTPLSLAVKFDRAEIVDLFRNTGDSRQEKPG